MEFMESGIKTELTVLTMLVSQLPRVGFNNNIYWNESKKKMLQFIIIIFIRASDNQPIVINIFPLKLNTYIKCIRIVETNEYK